jgi:hypothetical protein
LAKRLQGKEPQMDAQACLRFLVLASLFSSTVTCPAAAGETETAALGPDTRVRLDGIRGAAVRRAVQGARLRLLEPSCRRVLSEFTDTSGRPLQQYLDNMGLTATEYLSTMIFVEGSSQRACASGARLGGTQPGSRVVAICGAAFMNAEHQDSRLAEATILHEMLHTLGLGENPPSSSDITAQVLRSCQEPTATANRERP